MQWRNADPTLGLVPTYALSFTDDFTDPPREHPDKVVFRQVSSSFYGFSENTYSDIIAVILFTYHGKI